MIIEGWKVQDKVVDDKRLIESVQMEFSCLFNIGVLELVKMMEEIDRVYYRIEFIESDFLIYRVYRVIFVGDPDFLKIIEVNIQCKNFNGYWLYR